MLDLEMTKIIESHHPVIGRIRIQTEEGMNKYRQYRKRFYMESANRVGGREHGQNLPVRRRRACPPKAGLQEVNNTGGQVYWI